MPDSREAPASCPDLADLLLASEGELPKRRQSEVTAHLRVCPACRDQLGSVGLALREYQDAVSDANATTRVAEADASTGRLEVFRDRLQDERRTQTANRVRLPFRRWLPVAAAVPVLVGALFFSNRYTSVLRAEELLTKAAAQEQTLAPGTVRQLQFHIRRVSASRGHGNDAAQWSFTREIGGSNEPTVQTVTVSGGTVDENAELTSLFKASHFDLSDPLSSRSFRSWRDRLRSRTERVVSLSNDELLLQTSTTEGPLTSAELIVGRVDFQPRRQTLHFDGFGAVEIVELSRWVSRPPVVAKRSEPVSSSVTSPSPDTELLENAEVDARTELHGLNLDWDAGIAVRRSERGVEVRAKVNAARGREVSHVLRKLPLVHVILEADSHQAESADQQTGAAERARAANSAAIPNPSSVDSSVEAPAGPAPSGPRRADLPMIKTLDAPPLRRWLERTFGPGDRAGTFLPALAADTEHLRQRTAAFAALAQRYPEFEARRLPRPVRAKLESLADAQYRELVRAVMTLDDRLALFLGTSSRWSPGQEAPRPWQACATGVSARADELDRRIHVLLQQDDLPLPTEIRVKSGEPDALTELRKAADALWDQLQSAQAVRTSESRSRVDPLAPTGTTAPSDVVHSSGKS